MEQSDILGDNGTKLYFSAIYNIVLTPCQSPHPVIKFFADKTYPHHKKGAFHGTVLPALQATAIALGDVTNLSAEEKDNLEAEIIKEFVTSRIDLIPEEEFAAFYSYSEQYYDVYSFNLPNPYELAGFLDTYRYDWSVTFNSRKYDKLAFVEKVFEISEDEFRATYAEYPIIVNKMEEIVKVLNKYGVNIYQ